MRRALLSVGLLAASLFAASAIAQQPPGPPGGGPPPIPRTIPQRPGVPGMPPGARPIPPGGMPPGGRPIPPGGRPLPTAPVHHAAEPEHASHEHAECPGHGPDDPPPPINFWHGLAGVNNEKAQSDSALNKLLWRYENKDDPCDEKNEPPPFLASLINFGVLAYLIVRFGKKPLADSLVKRKQSIMGEIENASRLKKDAQKRLKEYKKHLETIEEKRASVMAEYAAQAELEKKHILAEAEERKARMKKDAEFRIEQELKAAQAAVLEEAVEEAAGAAEQLVAKSLGQADQDRIADEYLAGLADAVARSSPERPSPRAGGGA